MADRRSLISGLKDVPPPDPELARQFVYGDKASPKAKSDAAASEASETKTHKGFNRVPLTSRIRADYAQALKRASLERQLKGEFPNTVVEILEEALEPWLRDRGYIK